MSSAVLPKFPGFKWNRVKTPEFSTRVAQAVSGNERRVGLRVYPMWNFSWGYEFLRGQASPANHYQQMLGFFLSRGGRLESFLVNDESDNAVVDQPFGLGDGSTTAFQLVRTIDTFAEPVMNLNGAVTNIKNDGSTVSGGSYSVSSTGLVTFGSAPASGHVLTWTGAYYFRCRFLADAAEFEEFMYRFWNLKKLEFRGALDNRVL